MKANSKYLQGINKKKKITGSRVERGKVFQQSVQVQENNYLKITLEKRKKKGVCVQLAASLTWVSSLTFQQGNLRNQLFVSGKEVLVSVNKGIVLFSVSGILTIG